MENRRLEDLIIDKLDGTLSPEGERELEALLAERPEERVLYDALLALRNDVRALKRYHRREPTG